MPVLAVYGTLRKGQKYHHYLEEAVFLGSGQTVEKFALYLDEYPLVCKEKKTDQIFVEVYEVNAGQLKRVDQLEEHPQIYQREKVMIDLNLTQVEAWFYFYPQSRGVYLPGGDYTKYLSEKSAESN